MPCPNKNHHKSSKPNAQENEHSSHTRVFKSDRGALSAKDERETLLTTRSSSEKFILFSVVLTSGVVESVIELFIRSLTS